MSDLSKETVKATAMANPFDDPQHLANTADAMSRACGASHWQRSTAKYHAAVRDTLRAQSARIAALEVDLAEAQSCPPSVEDMTRLFLTWPLPEDFSPDAGITFEPVMNAGTAYEHKHQPVGTNLLNYKQAKAMVQHITGAGGAADDTPARPSVAEAAKIRDLTDEVEMAEARLVHFCNEVNAGNRQGGAREFLRQVDSQFRAIRDALRALAGEDGQ